MERKIFYVLNIILFTISAYVLVLAGKKYPFWVWFLTAVAVELLSKKLSELIVWIINRRKDKNDL
jgi:hypothetical protein